MIDFEFVSPTKIVFGKKAEEKVGEARAIVEELTKKYPLI